MSILKRFKEVLKNEASKQPVKKPVRVSDKFKSLLKSQNDRYRADRIEQQKKTKLPGRRRKYSDKKLLRILKAEAIRLNRTPTAVHFQNSKDLPSPIVYSQRWGSWNNAIRAAGLEPNLTVARRKSKQEKQINLPDDIPATESSKSIPKFQKIELYATLSDRQVEGGRLVQELGTQLSLDATSINEAVNLYKKMVEEGLLRGRVKELLASATIYLICRKRKKPKTLNEIAQTAGISPKALMQTARSIKNKMKLEIYPLRPLDFFDGIANQLHLNDDVKTSAKAILRSPVTKRFSISKNPLSIVATAIYIAGLTCGSSITQYDIAKVAGITEVTIRNRYKVLAQKLGIDLTKYIPSRYIELMKLPPSPRGHD